MTAKLISYCRVSTERQGASGLGLQAQESAIEAYASQSGGTLIGRFVEIESGKRADRPELSRALAHAKRTKAVLVVAKLDRLARNVAFLSRLMESGVEFIAVDNPSANRLTVHILAAVAEAEAKAISERTKSALAAAKARGMLLGSARPGHWDGREERRRAGAANGAKASIAVRSKAAMDAFADLLPIIQQQKNEGGTLQQIAAKLNGEGYTTRRGKEFTPMTVKRILERTTEHEDDMTDEEREEEDGGKEITRLDHISNVDTYDLPDSIPAMNTPRLRRVWAMVLKRFGQEPPEPPDEDDEDDEDEAEMEPVKESRQKKATKRKSPRREKK